MKIVGITGGIGSGKSTVSKILTTMGYPVFDSDQAGKLAYNNEKIRTAVISLLGSKIIDEQGKLNFKAIAEMVFTDHQLLLSLNKIIHPFVQNTFEKWCENQNSKVVFKESAILFESGAHLHCDFVVSVITDKKTRINRILIRNPELTEETIQDRIKTQITDKEKIEKSDFILHNTNTLLIPQVNAMLSKLH